MNRRSAFLSMIAAAAIVLGAVLVVGVGIAMGAWVPKGPDTASASEPPDFGPGPGQQTKSWEAFLTDVRGGTVQFVFQHGRQLDVSDLNTSYTVVLEDPSIDVLAEIEAAANEAGVAAPEYQNEQGGERPTESMTYDELLEQVELGAIHDVTQSGTLLQVSAANHYYEIQLPEGVDNVLADIEAAAQRGGKTPPGYSKYPG